MFWEAEKGNENSFRGLKRLSVKSFWKALKTIVKKLDKKIFYLKNILILFIQNKSLENSLNFYKTHFTKSF